MGAANELCDPGQITLASLCLMGVRTASLGGLSSALGAAAALVFALLSRAVPAQCARPSDRSSTSVSRTEKRPSSSP